MSSITIADAAMMAAIFLNKKSPVIFIFLTKNVGEVELVRANPPMLFAEYAH